MGVFYNDISDCELQALVDNEVSSTERASLMSRIRHCPQAFQRLEQLFYQKQILKALWKGSR